MISGGMKRRALTGNRVLSSDFEAYNVERDAASVRFSLFALEVEEHLRAMWI